MISIRPLRRIEGFSTELVVYYYAQFCQVTFKNSTDVSEMKFLSVASERIYCTESFLFN